MASRFAHGADFPCRRLRVMLHRMVTLCNLRFGPGRGFRIREGQVLGV
jgi:hypothetical protein